MDLGEELCALEAIFGADDCKINVEERFVAVFVPCKATEPNLKLSLHFPVDYPAEAPPVVELCAPQLSEDQIQRLTTELNDLFIAGEVVAFDMVEMLRGREELWLMGCHPATPSPQIGGAAGEGKRPEHREPRLEREQPAEEAYSEEQQRLMELMTQRIVTGEPHTERKSTFQAHVARVESVAEVQAMMAVLLQDSKIRRAAHNMMAFRFHDAEKGTCYQDSDDDGESAAGSRMLHLLQVAGADGVCVCVTRWFGGTLLGPSRFTIINNTARKLLEQEGFLHEASGKRGGRRK